MAGLSVAFTGPSGVRADAFGVASADGTPLTPDSMFQAGSVSKAVTAYAAHRLAAEGRLDLDADVNEVLTSWRLPRVRGWQPAVSVRGLLAHVAGVSSGWGDGSVRGEPVPGLLEVLAGTATAPPLVLDALPGLTWAYSGGGYLVVAQAICDVTGLGFDEAMAELVLGPADMVASTFRQPLPGPLERAAARGESWRRAGTGWLAQSARRRRGGPVDDTVGSCPVRPCRQRRPVGADAARAPRGASHGQRGVPHRQRARRPLVVP